MFESLLSQVTPETLTNVSQLGVAGLMGGLWWWERRLSRQREDELTAAHQKVMEQGEHITVILDALQQNTRAIATFTTVQQEIVGLLRGPSAGHDAAPPPAPHSAAA